RKCRAALLRDTGKRTFLMLQVSNQRLDRKKIEDRPKTISAELAGSDTATALGITATGYSPALALCRSLLAAGLDPDTAMHVYWNGTLALRIRAIGEAARLTVEDDHNGHPRFRLARERRHGAAPSMRSEPTFDQSARGRL